MEDIELILSLAVTASSLFIACVSFLVKLIKNIRKKIKLQKYNDLLDSVAPIVEIAENYTDYGGADKKAYVLEKVEQYASENGIEFDAQAVDDRIEELIEFSKRVNKREK